MLPSLDRLLMQRERGAAAAQLAEAKARIHEVLDQLAAERSQTAALKVRPLLGVLRLGPCLGFRSHGRGFLQVATAGPAPCLLGRAGWDSLTQPCGAPARPHPTFPLSC